MKRLLLTFTFLLLFVFNSFAQDFCGTPAITNIENAKKLSSSQKRSANSSYILTVYFHVIRNSLGIGDVSTSIVTSAYNKLNEDFNSHGISFHWDGIVDYIDDDAYYYNNPDTCTSIFNVNNHINGIDIYLYPIYPSYTYQYIGSVKGVGVSSELYVIGEEDNIPSCTNCSISHEMGHVLNLWHTHHGTFDEGGNDTSCPELVNGSNSSSCGDYVEDTPADPKLSGNVNANCVYTGTRTDANNQAYTPDVDLIMSYARKSCRTRFSTKQGERMRDAIENLPYLMHTQHRELSGPTTICSSSSNTYSINNIPSYYTVNWNINNSNFSITPSGSQCQVTYIGTPQYSFADLTATISWQGQTIKTLTKRIVMHETDLSVTGWQYGGQTTPNGSFPDREFTIPNNNRSLLSSTKPEKPSMEEILGRDSLPIDFIGDDIFPIEPIPYDDCGYGFTEINGGNMVYLNSTRFNDMDISFSGTYSPTAFNRNGSYISFKMPYNNNEYYTTLEVHSETQCHDFCIMFKVVPLPGSAYGDDDIWVEFIGSMLYINYMVVGVPNGNGQFYFPSFSLTISRIPSGNQVYSGIFSGEDCPIAVNTSSWLPGLYSIRLICNNQIYTKTFHI